MRGTPRTKVHFRIPVLRAPWVVFELGLCTPALAADERRECERYWDGLGLTGAFAFVDLLERFNGDESVRVLPIRCADWRLTANVVHRIRQGFLHARFPLIDQLDPTPRKWASDDPRLTRLVTTEVSL